MKNILLIGTGGTIASDVTEDGLAPGADHRAAFEPSPRHFRHLQCGLRTAFEFGQHEYAPGALAENGPLYPGKL